MKQLENDLQCKNESDVIGRVDLFGGTGHHSVEIILGLLSETIATT